jgi:hypothetical protein
MEHLVVGHMGLMVTEVVVLVEDNLGLAEVCRAEVGLEEDNLEGIVVGLLVEDKLVVQCEHIEEELVLVEDMLVEKIQVVKHSVVVVLEEDNPEVDQVVEHIVVEEVQFVAENNLEVVVVEGVVGIVVEVGFERTEEEYHKLLEEVELVVGRIVVVEAEVGFVHIVEQFEVDR